MSRALRWDDRRVQISAREQEQAEGRMIRAFTVAAGKPVRRLPQRKRRPPVRSAWDPEPK